MLISVTRNPKAGNGLWAFSKSFSSLFSYLNVLSTSAFLLLVRLTFIIIIFFFYFLLSKFFWKDVFKLFFFQFPLSFYQLRVNDKIEIERKNWLFISAFQQMHISIGERKKKSFFNIFYKGQ